MKFFDKLIIGVMIFFVVFGIVGLGFMLTEWTIKSSECAKDYGGKLVRGYCTYVENGSSKSFSIWDFDEDTISESNSGGNE